MKKRLQCYFIIKKLLAKISKLNQSRPVVAFLCQDLYHIDTFLVRTQVYLRRVSLQNRFSGYVENRPVEVVAIRFQLKHAIV